MDLPTVRRIIEDDVAAQIIGECMSNMYKVDYMDLARAMQSLMKIGEIYR